MKKLKILSMPVDDGGCGWYRIRQPFEMLHRFTSHDVHIIDKEKDSMIEVGKALLLADVIVLRPGAERGLRQLVAIPELSGIKAKTVMDIDDNTEIISPYNYHYEEYGTQEYFDQNLGKWLWKDGEGNFDLARNRAKLASLIQGMREVDLITATTPKLADYARQYNPNVAVLPNCINFERWWKLPLKPNQRLRVGWSGGVSHYEDWYEIKEPLNRLLREYQFTLVMVGADFSGIIEEDNRHLVELHDWVPFKGHSYRMMCMALDMAIVPLANLPFNHYKSAVKWYEMSAMGVPSLVSNVTPYKEEIEDGKTAMAFFTAEEFYKKAKVLIEDASQRRKIGSNAQKWVRIHRDAKSAVFLWEQAYNNILDYEVQRSR